MTKSNIGLALLAGAGTLAFSWTAHAQTAAESELSEVVITGSRVITNGNDSPTPVTVVTVEDILASHPSKVYDGLLDMPQFAGSRGTAASNPGGTGANNNNINAPNLRGLGTIRTLVLFDGHRMPPTQQDFLVDANLIPQMLLQRIDVVTGGASAVYGSDAVSGVVNFITDRKFNGVKVQARAGISEQGDSESYDVGIAFGTDLFGGRGHFEGSFETNYDAGILRRTDRSNLVPRWTAQGSCSPTPTSNPANPSSYCPVPFYLAANATISTQPFGGRISGAAAGTYNGYYFANNGVATQFVNGVPNGVTGSPIQLGGAGGYNTGSGLKAQLGFQQIFGRFDFDLSGSTHAFVMATGTNQHQFSYNGDSRTNSPGVNLSTGNAFLPATVAAAMTPNSSFAFNKLWGGNNPDGASPIPTQNGDLDVDFRYLSTGLDGSLGRFKWDIAYTYGDAKQHAVQNANINYGRFLAAVDAVTVTAANVGTSGQTLGSIVCNVTLTNPGLYPGCVPVNLFGPTSESQAAVDYLVQKTAVRTENRSDNVGGSIAGVVFDDWAGPVNMALSGEWRELSYESTSDAVPAFESSLDCTGLNRAGITNNCTPRTVNSAGVVTNAGTGKWLFGASATRTPVSETVGEAALEANVPLLADKRFAQGVDLNAAVRYARYDIQGNPVVTQPDITRTFNATTWKAGLTWHFNDALTLRATRSRDFRAPNLAELFAPATIAANNGFVDVITGQVPPGSVTQSSGNPKLDPEIANTTTAGLVVRPTPNFSIAIDGYDVQVNGFIANASGQNQTFQRTCYENPGSSGVCDLIERSPTTGLITKMISAPTNFGEQHTYGVDLELNYKMDIADHPLSLRGLVAYQPHVIYTIPLTNDTDAAGTINGAQGSPVGGVVRASVFARYAVTNQLSVDWSTRWRSGLHHNTDPMQLDGTPRVYSPATAWSNFTLSYRTNPSFGQMDIYFNVQNLFNQMPHPVAFSGAAQEPGLFGGLALGDDPVGRYYTLGVRLRL